MLGSRGRSRSLDLRVLADEELMGLVRDGEVQAFEVIFDRHAPAAFSLAYRMCGRRAAAEDIVQDAFLSLWRSASGYDPRRVDQQHRAYGERRGSARGEDAVRCQERLQSK